MKKTPPRCVSRARFHFLSSLFLLLGFIPVFLAAPAMGAVVTWNTAAVNTDTSNASQISTSGTPVAAVDINSTFTASSYTVNGVTFTASNANVTMGYTNKLSGMGAAPGSTTYSNILSAGAYISPDSDSPLHPIHLSGLTSGHSYQLQIWTPYWNTNYPTRFSDVAPTGPSYNHTLNESPSLNVGVGSSVISQYVLGTFTASGTTQDIYYYGDGGAGLIGALQVRDLGAGSGSATFTGAQILPGTGSMSYDAPTGTYTIGGTGFLQWGMGPESGYFTYTPVIGDIELTARVKSFDNHGQLQGQVAFCMRPTTFGGSDQDGAAMWVQNYNASTDMLWNINHGPVIDGSANYYNTIAGGNNQRSHLTPPFWIKLVRIGNNWASFWSVDGVRWGSMASGGGLFINSGNYNIGFCVTNGNAALPATAVIDNVYVGAPRLKYKTSWVGNSSNGDATGFVSNRIYALWVKPGDGTCYTNGDWEENGSPLRVYKNGAVFHGFFPGTGYTGHAGAGLEGSITGNASKIFYAYKDQVYQTDFTTNDAKAAITFHPPAMGWVGGLAASGSQIFVSDPVNDLVRIVSTSTLTETAQFSFSKPGPIAFDGTNFWITHCPSTFPTKALSWNFTTYSGAAIDCVSPAGVDLSVTSPSTHAAITDVAVPTGLAYDDRGTVGTTSDDRLYICDNGPNQQVRYYTNLTSNPSFGGTLGTSGGIWASTPGTITANGFYGLTGVGVDSSHNVYVSCMGGSYESADLRMFNSSGVMQWRLNGLVFCSGAAFDPDPAKDGKEIYTPNKHFTMNYANTAPGSEWSYTGYTRNPMTFPNEGRSAPFACLGTVKLARIGSPANLYMYTGGQGTTSKSWLYYFNSETAVPFGTNGFDGTAPNVHQIWIDKNLNGTIDTGEATSAPPGNPGGQWLSFMVDTVGDIWMNSTGYIRRVVCLGTQTLPVTGSPVVPKYDLSAAGGYLDYIIPTPLTEAWNIYYDNANITANRPYGNDVLYAVGKTSAGTWTLTRTDRWLANPDNRTNPVATWSVSLPPTSEPTILIPPEANFNYGHMDVASDKIFVQETYGRIHVYDAARGNLELSLNPGPEISGSFGWDDMPMGINACKRSTGEYVVTSEDSGHHGCDLLYRWTPSAETSVSLAPAGLTATPGGQKIFLAWQGPDGALTSYNIYRGTASGGETLYQSGVSSPAFTDANIVPGTTYYYKVSAVNAAGESPLSNEASAAAVSAQVDFVKADTTTRGNWYTAGSPPTYIYGSQGYYMPQSPNAPDLISSPAPTGVTSLTHTGVDSLRFRDYSTPTHTIDLTDPCFLQLPGSSSRTDDFYSGSSQSYNIIFSDSDWHQVAIYMMNWNDPNTYGLKVDVLAYGTTTVLDTRQPMNIGQGKWLVWNVRGNVTIHVSMTASWPAVNGIFFDPVQVSTPSIAWWKLDDTGSTNYIAADSSGAGCNATRSGTAAWNTSGKINGCVSLPGGTACVTPPSATFTGRNPVSVSAWFKTSATTGAVIASYANAASSPTISVPLLYVDTAGKLQGSFYTGASTPTTMMSSTATVNNGAWHHAALVAEGGKQTLYLDGAVADAHAATLSTTALNYNYLGYGTTSGYPSVSTPTNTFNGYLDDVRIYDKALKPSEVYQMYNHP